MIAVRYCSKSGNTKKVAKLLGEKLGVEALSVEEPLTGQIDKLYLGGAVHGKKYPELKKFAQELDPSQIGEVYMFGTSGGVFSIKKELMSALKESGVRIGKDAMFLHGFAPKIKSDLNDNQLAEVDKFIEATK